jgi:hypothetical protein
MAGRKNIDWEAIQREYRAGVLSVREIASLYKISHAAILKRAKKFPGQWKRDLTAKVQAELARRIVADEVTSEGKEDEIVQTSAERMLAVIRQHRTSIAKLTVLEQAFAEELGGLNKPVIGKKQGKDVALSTKVSTLLALVTASEKRVKMERQAFGISDATKPDGETITEIPVVFVEAKQ